MVATRRQVQNGPDEDMFQQDPDQILKKKPLRKPPTKAPVTKTSTRAKTATTTRNKALDEEVAEEAGHVKPATRRAGTRAKKVDVSIDAVASAEDNAPSGRASRAANTGSVRGKKVVGDAEEAVGKQESSNMAAAKSVKPASVRGRKAAALRGQAPVEDAVKPTRSTKAGSIRGKKTVDFSTRAPVLQAPAEAKPARSTRGAIKAAPLSPKKITQVTKLRTRTTRNAEPKLAAKAVPKKPSGTAGTLRRKRGVSDENADIPDDHVDVDDIDMEDVPLISSTPITVAAKATRTSKRIVSEAQTELSMSSRPTTPADSPVRNFDIAEEDEHVMPEDEDHDSEVDKYDSEVGDDDNSEDELCGPKTPMRRSSPGAYARYQSSIQRTIHKHEDGARAETPAQRYAVLGTQRGTPQTQKPYCKPIPPTSEIKPMTASRSTGRALIFKDLCDDASAPNVDEDEVDGPADISFFPDENIIPMDIDDVEDQSTSQLQAQPATEIEEASRNISSFVEEDEEDYVVPADVQKYGDDPDDTVIVHDIDEVVPESAEPAAMSFETEDTVIITHPEAEEHVEDMSDDVDESDDGSVIVHSEVFTPPARNSTTGRIAVDFDKHLMNDVPSTTGDTLMHLDIEPSTFATEQYGQDTVAGVEMDVDADVSILHNVSRRQTVNFNDFINVEALEEPTVHMQLDEDLPQAMDANGLALDANSVDAEAAPASHSNEEEAQSQDDSFHQELAASAPVDGEVMASEPLAQQESDAEAMEVHEETHVPHYALPTIAFDARRKSLPVLGPSTPTKTNARPSTSDGASMPRIANPFSQAWWSRPIAPPTPSKARPSTAGAEPNVSSFSTPIRPSTLEAASVKATPKERYPMFPPRQNYDGISNTVAAPLRFATPHARSPKRRETFHKAVSGKIVAQPAESVTSTPVPVPVAVETPRERYPALRSRDNYEEHAKTVAGPVRFQTPTKKSPNRRQTFHKAIKGDLNIASTERDDAASDPRTPVSPAITTPLVATTTERYPRLRPRPDYEEHAKTVAGPARFQTPLKRSLKRPATVGKSDSLRRAALAAKSPISSYTPVKTPLKAPATTPSQAPMTPHPAAPLRGVVALVEVFTLEGASASAPFITLLHRLGAKTTRSWNDRITHVVFKDGSPTTLQRIRLNNKDFEDTSKGPYIHCVNSRWVTDCETEGARVDESDEAYVVDVAEIPRGGKRRRKSMEPSALLNLGGNIVRDRKSSVGRVSSFGKSSLKLLESPAKKTEEAEMSATPATSGVGKENSGDEQSSPVTPAWIAAPSELVQKTAPLKRMKKLALPGKDEVKNRRLTFWNGAV